MTGRSACPSGGTGQGFDRIQEECRWLVELAGRLAGGAGAEAQNGNMERSSPHFAALAMPLGWRLGIPVGSLTAFWARGRLVSVCPKCGGTSYVMGAVASSPGRDGRWFGICPECRSAVAGRKPGLAMLCRLAAAWAGSLAGRRADRPA
jgi:hypothetical protein